MRLAVLVVLASLLPALGACRERQEPAPAEPLQTIGLKLEAPGVPRALELALSLPERVAPEPVVEALSGALHKALKTCVGGAEPLRFDADRVIALRLRGAAIEQVLTDPGPGTACLAETLERHELSRRFDSSLDVHVLLRALAAE
jgi:hypothetical protein